MNQSRRPTRLTSKHCQLAPRLGNLAIEELFFGWMFLASGTVVASPAPSPDTP